MMRYNPIMMQIDAVSFSMFDTALYLDTHPGDRRALAYFDKLKAKREALMKECNGCAGPLTLMEADGKACWDWTDRPLPWESEA